MLEGAMPKPEPKKEPIQHAFVQSPDGTLMSVDPKTGKPTAEQLEELQAARDSLK